MTTKAVSIRDVLGSLYIYAIILYACNWVDGGFWGRFDYLTFNEGKANVLPAVLFFCDKDILLSVLYVF